MLFYPSDFFLDEHVKRMTNSQLALYWRLLWEAWQANPPASIPSDVDSLFQVSHCERREDFDRDIPAVLRCFKQKNGRLVQKRMQAEYTRASAKQKARTKGGQARWNQEPKLIEQQMAGKAKASSIEEVEDYAKVIALSSNDGAWFWDKNEGCGWKNNGRPILDWKATMRTWRRMNIFPSQKLQQQQEHRNNRSERNRAAVQSYLDRLGENDE